MSPWMEGILRGFQKLHPPTGSEGFEFMVSAPEVLLRKNPDTGKTEEPFEDRADSFEAQRFKFQTRFLLRGEGGESEKVNYVMSVIVFFVATKNDMKCTSMVGVFHCNIGFVL